MECDCIIIEKGPVEAGIPRSALHRRASKVISDRTIATSAVSFAMGLPGGPAALATIPADMLQFYGVALRMAQELAYLYGRQDMWAGGALDEERAVNHLIIYCGSMLGVTGAVSMVRVISSKIAGQVVRQLPKKHLQKRSIIQSLSLLPRQLALK